MDDIMGIDNSKKLEERDSTSEQRDHHEPEGSAKTVVISTKKIQANRANALKGGVKTAEGKRRSRRNALKHGMRATTLLLEDDEANPEADDLRLARAELRYEFGPRTFTEAILVDAMVLAVQQMGRGRKFEATELALEAPFNYPAIDRLLRYSRDAYRKFFKALAELRNLREEEVDEVKGD